MAAGGLRVISDTLTPGLASFGPKLAVGVKAVFELYADKSTSYMRANAPWQDQTGNARNGLNAVAFSSPDRSVIVLFHQMPYGIWLEVRDSGRFAIILPTVEEMGPQVMDTLKKLVTRLS